MSGRRFAVGTPMRRTRSACCARRGERQCCAAESRDELPPSHFRPPGNSAEPIALGAALEPDRRVCGCAVWSVLVKPLCSSIASLRQLSKVLRTKCGWWLIAESTLAASRRSRPDRIVGANPGNDMIGNVTTVARMQRTVMTWSRFVLALMVVSATLGRPAIHAADH
jgi:hypothetical protein